MIVIIDYGMGNVGSVRNALKTLGYDSVVSSQRKDIESATHIILPGVGAFGDGMKQLKKSGCLEILNRKVLEKKKPFLGICLGMQMLAKIGLEGGRHQGLGWIEGVTRKFSVNEKRFRIPHIGWNDVVCSKGSILFRGVLRPIFYFVHSYFLEPNDKSVISATANYGEQFAAAIEYGNIFGVQFHPEKSQSEGLKVLKNFIDFKNK